MLFKYCPLIFLFNRYVAGGIDMLFFNHGFNFLNDELNCTAVEKFNTSTRWIKQKIDNFNTKDGRVWKMRYFERLSFYKPNGPIYLFLGGEDEVCPLWAAKGIMYELAKETNGAMYVSEHRYYGKSIPLNGTDAEAFKYLSARQALADNANLLKTIKSKSQYKKSKVVVIGGSYPGNLAAWMRLLYPNLVDAALASSAPVLAKMDFYEYLEKVNDNYEQYGTKNCLATIRKIFKRYEKLMQSREGIEELKREENICEKCDMTLAENQHTFFMSKAYVFKNNSQNGRIEHIKNHCERLLNSSKTETTGENCTCYGLDAMNGLSVNDKNNTWNLPWTYQTCNEFGYFQTTSSYEQPFKNYIPLEFYIRICQKLFGPEFDEERVNKGVAEVNNLYGGLNPNVTNVVFSNGDLDPWSTLSILKDLTHNAPAVVIPRSSHCRDLLSNEPDDIEELRDARKYIKKIIKKWIGVTVW
ncbi:thymus-specific serine protease-like [Bicyclus anynana]|uniref:Thymus-specific serine protease-like n=1 Tax=Bicyclus anynana TaxID=110368 RepID=A0A6J1MS58_BICAN|nr:thymus-specific serine protease-like [Bicyclus anynana]